MSLKELDPLSPNKRVAEIDGLRGISIIMVVAGHLIAWRYAAYFPDPVVQLGVFFSNLGVMLFFVISGYVITALTLCEQRRETFSVKRFYLRRAIRIIPPLFVYLSVVGICTAMGYITQDQLETVKAAFFTCNVSDCGWFVGHTWTLAYEWQFYMLFPAALLLGRSLLALLILASVATAGAMVIGWMPDETKSVIFLSLGCAIAHCSKTAMTIVNSDLVKPLGTFLKTRVLQFFGMISYSLYLWQQLFTSAPSGYPEDSLLLLPVLVLPLAYLSYLLLEKNVGLALKKLCAPLVPSGARQDSVGRL